MYEPGLVHTPVTPFTREQRIDFDLYGRLLDFHLNNGADALALPMHAGESVSLTDDEQAAVLEFALKRVDGRVGVIAHVSDAGTGIAAARARRAEQMGVAAVVATTPYYWTPPPAMIVEHFAQIGAAVRVPLLVYNSPEEMTGTKITAELCLKLIERCPNFVGVVDLSLDWQFMIELLTYAPAKRKGFALWAGNELFASAAAVGAKGLFAPLAGIAPALVRRLYDACRNEEFDAARPLQEEIASLQQALKSHGVAGLKAALRGVGRDCGEPRPPLQAFDDSAERQLAATLAAMPALRNEPRGW